MLSKTDSICRSEKACFKHKEEIGELIDTEFIVIDEVDVALVEEMDEATYNIRSRQLSDQLRRVGDLITDFIIDAIVDGFDNSHVEPLAKAAKEVLFCILAGF